MWCWPPGTSRPLSWPETSWGSAASILPRTSGFGGWSSRSCRRPSAARSVGWTCVTRNQIVAGLGQRVSIAKKTSASSDRGEPAPGEAGEIGGGEVDLQAALAGRDVDRVEVRGRRVDDHADPGVVAGGADAAHGVPGRAVGRGVLVLFCYVFV